MAEKEKIPEREKVLLQIGPIIFRRRDGRSIIIIIIIWLIIIAHTASQTEFPVYSTRV